MLTMNADRWIYLLALCSICASSNDFVNPCEQSPDVCETHTVSVQLDSSVLLPCNFNNPTNISLNWVSWTHISSAELVRLTSRGRIKFFDHRYGRVRAFPNQGSVGNYSICLDKLQLSDLGCYRCTQEDDCLQVVVQLGTERGAPNQDTGLVIYICVGAGVFLMLIIGGYCCMKLTLAFNNATQDNLQGASIEAAGASAPPAETVNGPVNPQPSGAGNDNLVYENDDQVPSNQQNYLPGNYCVPIGHVADPGRTQPTPGSSGLYPDLSQFERVQSQRTKRRFHRELFNRLRQASINRRYYVNQAEMNNQQARSTQAEDNLRGGQYKNPIYNRSTDQLPRP